MKKTLLLLGLIILPAALFAQGTVQFNNTGTTQLSTNSTATPPPGQLANRTGVTQAGYTIGLYVAPQGTTDPNAFSLNGPTTASQSGALGQGRFNGNPLPANFTISNNNGTAIAFQVRAWSTSAGATYALAVTAQLGNPGVYLGVSSIGEVTPATGIVQAPPLFGTAAGQVGGFILTPGAGPIVPEPSSIALGLLGLGAIALFRRRR